MPPGVDAGESQTDRGVSPVIAVVLMVGVVLVLAAVVGGFVFVLGDEIEEPAASVSVEADVQITGSFDRDEIVLTHKAGDSVPVENIEIIIDNGATIDRLLPRKTDGGLLSDEDFADERELLTNTGADAPLNAQNPEPWQSGQRLVLTLLQGAGDSGDQIEVTIVDIEGEAIIAEKTVTLP